MPNITIDETSMRTKLTIKTTKGTGESASERLCSNTLVGIIRTVYGKITYKICKTVLNVPE